MSSTGVSRRGAAVGLAAGAVALCAGVAGISAPAAAAPALGSRRAAGSTGVICTSRAHPFLAARLASGIRAALRGRSSTVALRLYDKSEDMGCSLNTTMHFDSASVVKVTILGALLRIAMNQHRHLTGAEVALATRMITQSDNNAASALWNQVGHARLQNFLNLANMGETQLGPTGYWGLTQITAHDESLLLGLLEYPNRVLDTPSRNFALGLMARVIPSQRWGVPAGAPTSLSVHVKNGWLPLATHGWRIHSIGLFTGHNRGYSIAVLTDDNPSMAYGIDTIERVAEVIHRQLNPVAAEVIPPSTQSPSWGHPDEQIPAAHGGR
jgi:hypothetical protein